MDKSTVLVLGRESSATRMVSKFVANLLGITQRVEEWDGRWEIEDNQYQVYHRSLPHGPRDRFVEPEEFGGSDEVLVVLCIRDNNIAYKSAFNTHNKGKKKTADTTDQLARETIAQIITKDEYEFVFFDYEAATYLGDVYLNWWAKEQLGLKNTSNLKVRDENKKYLK